MRTCLFLILTIVLTGCPKHDAGQVRPPASGQETGQVTGQQPMGSSLRKRVNSQLDKKKYRQALELMNKHQEGFEKEQAQAMNGLIETGNEAAARGDNAAAARAYKSALGHYPSDPVVREKIRQDPKQLRSSLDASINHLMEKGLQEYRHDHLETAVKIWKELLSINPDHHEARKALNTATTQLHALQNIKK